MEFVLLIRILVFCLKIRHIVYASSADLKNMIIISWFDILLKTKSYFDNLKNVRVKMNASKQKHFDKNQ